MLYYQIKERMNVHFIPEVNIRDGIWKNSSCWLSQQSSVLEKEILNESTNSTKAGRKESLCLKNNRWFHLDGISDKCKWEVLTGDEAKRRKLSKMQIALCEKQIFKLENVLNKCSFWPKALGAWTWSGKSGCHEVAKVTIIIFEILFPCLPCKNH